MIYKLFEAGELGGYTVGRKKVIFADAIPEYQERHSNKKPILANPVQVESTQVDCVSRKGEGVAGFRHFHL